MPIEDETSTCTSSRSREGMIAGRETGGSRQVRIDA